MKSNKISPLLNSQLPEHIAGLGTGTTTFQLFLETYYEFMEARKGSVGTITQHSKNIDIDNTLDEFIDDFYKTYGEYIPKNTEYDRRDFVKRLSFLQKSKGTTNAIKLLFKLVYNEESEVYFPKESILRASDGVWSQDVSVRVSLISGDLDLFADISVMVDDPSITARYTVKRMIEIAPGIFDLFFPVTANVIFNVGDRVVFLENSLEIAVGDIIQTPADIEILVPGKNFSIGRVFKIPGQSKDTIARVKNVGPNGEIVKAEILDFGGVYTTAVSETISPFNFPIESGVIVDFVDNEYSASIENRTNGFIERVEFLASTSAGNPLSYFAEDYNAEPYNGAELVNQEEDQSVGLELPTVYPGNLTEEEVFSSLGSVKLNLGNSSKYPGSFISDRGQISNSYIRLQDSLFFQEYSYVIKSSILLRKFKSFYDKMMHPAGLKLFAEIPLVEENDSINIRASMLSIEQ